MKSSGPALWCHARAKAQRGLGALCVSQCTHGLPWAPGQCHNLPHSTVSPGHEHRVPSAFSPTSFQVSLHKLYHPATQIVPAHWDLLPFTCLLWYHTTTNCTFPFIHNIHHESPEWHDFSIMFLSWSNILIFIIISSTLSATESYCTNPNPKIFFTIFCQWKWYGLFSCTAAHTTENVHFTPCLPALKVLGVGFFMGLSVLVFFSS